MNATGLIVDGKPELLPGLTCTNWIDDPTLRLRKGEDYRSRSTKWIRQVVCHTTKGIPGGTDQRYQDIRAGLGPSTNAGERTARWWSVSPEPAGAHVVVDFDGAVYNCADLLLDAAYHAQHANETSIGIEMYQGPNAELYEGQLDAVVRLIDWITARFGIQRMVPHRYLGGPISRLVIGPGQPNPLVDVVGVIGHRDLTQRRGAGDPGSAIFYRLGAAGYEPVDYSLSEDRDLVRRRQRDLGIDPADGIAGPATVAALRASGHPSGTWVSRPGDDAFAATGVA